MPGDIVYTDWATENLQVHYNDRQQWYYLPDQTVDEVLIFKSAESSPDKSQGKWTLPPSGNEKGAYRTVHYGS